MLGADFVGEADPADPAAGLAMFAGMEAFDPLAIAEIIQQCCPATLAHRPIRFEWASTCSKPRTGAFGGGWCAIFADRIEVETTREALSEALAGGIV